MTQLEEPQQLEKLLEAEQSWSRRQRHFKIKGFTIPLYTVYACYQDARRDPSKESFAGKFFRRLDPALLELELVKAVVYGVGAYSALSSFTN